MSRKDDSPAISLFSFQDIITSITGIMFLVVILLVIFLFESKPKKADADPETVKMQKSIYAEIVELEKILADFRKQEEEQKKLLAELQKMSPETIEKRKKELEKRISGLKIRQRVILKDQAEMRLFKEDAIKNIQNLKIKSENTVKKSLETEQQITENKKILEDLKIKVAEAKKSVSFSVEKSSDKKFILAEFGKNGFRIKDFVLNQDHDLRKPGISDEEHIDNFILWVSKRDRNNEFISVILGPSKLKYWQYISGKLKEMFFVYGVEFYPDDDSTIFIDNHGGGK